MSDHPVDALIRRLQTEASQYKLQWEALRDTFTEAEKFREQLQSQLVAHKLANEKLKKDKYEITKSWLETIETALRQKEEIQKLTKE